MLKNKILISVLFIFLLNLFAAISTIYINGTFVYALDDPYIHLSMAENFHQKLILSVDGINFASASSSPLWFILLSFFTFLGDFAQYMPFLLNIIFQCLTVIMITLLTEKYFHFKFSLISFFLLILITPMIALSLGGMEHSLHILLVITVLYYFLESVRDIKANYLFLVLFSMLTVATRYEGLAFILMISVLLFFNKNYVRAVLLFVCSLVPVLIFGIYAYSFDLGFIPSSIMAKSQIGNSMNIDTIILFIKKILNGFSNIHIFLLFIINMLIIIMSYYHKNKELLSLTIVFIGTLFLHISFAKLGWLYRYEAYIIVFGYLNLMIALEIYKNHIFKHKKFKSFIFAIIYLSLIFSFSNQLKGNLVAIQGTKNIFEQQIQIASFLRKYYNESKIAANDIGAITYFTKIELLDLVGLGSYKIVKLIKEGKYNSDMRKQIIYDNDVELIIIYDNWFKDIKSFKNKYKQIGSWIIQDNKVCGSDTVSFYSKKSSFKQNQKKFNDFKSYLPKDVIVKDYYEVN